MIKKKINSKRENAEYITFFSICSKCGNENQINMSYNHAAQLYHGQILTYTCQKCKAIFSFDLSHVKHVIDSQPKSKINHFYDFLATVSPQNNTHYNPDNTDSTGEIIGVIIVLGFIFFFFILPILNYTNNNIIDPQTIPNNINNNTSSEITLNLYENPREAKFNYVINGKKWTVTTKLYKGLSDYLQELPRNIYYTHGVDYPPTDYNFLAKKLDNTKQKPFLDSFIQFVKDKNISDEDKVRLIVNLVQQVPYDYSASDYQVDIGKYPYEVLYKNKGVCGEKALLLIYFLRSLGYGTAYLKFEKESHAAVGIKCTSQYDYKDTGYCFIESTTPNIITDYYGEYRNAGELKSIPAVIIISEGKTYSGAKEDYENTQRYQKLEENHTSLSDYKEWLELRKKYGLEKEQCEGEAILCNGDCWTPCEVGTGFYCTSNGAICKR